LVPHGASDFDIAMCSISPALCHSTLIQCTVASSIIKPTDAAISLDSIFYQDNESAIKLEENGRKSCGEKSRHIDIRYFLLKMFLSTKISKFSIVEQIL